MPLISKNVQKHHIKFLRFHKIMFLVFIYHSYCLALFQGAPTGLPQHIRSCREMPDAVVHKIQNYPPKYFVRELFTLLGHLFFQIHIFQLHTYKKKHRIRVSYSKYYFIIQNTPKHQNTFENNIHV